MKHILLLLPIVLITGCSASQKLARVARQNIQNSEALTGNVKVLFSLYQGQLEAVSQTYLLNQINRLRKELITVVGRAGGSGPDAGATWEGLFAGKTPYESQRGEILNVIKQSPSDDRLFDLKRRHGWIYSTAQDPTFTPEVAHKLVQMLQDLQDKTANDPKQFVAKAYVLCGSYDPRVDLAFTETNVAKQVAQQLGNEILRQLNIQDLQNRAILANAEGTVELSQALGQVAGDQQIQAELGQILERNIPNNGIRQGVRDLLLQPLLESTK